MTTNSRLPFVFLIASFILLVCSVSLLVSLGYSELVR